MLVLTNQIKSNAVKNHKRADPLPKIYVGISLKLTIAQNYQSKLELHTYLKTVKTISISEFLNDYMISRLGKEIFI